MPYLIGTDEAGYAPNLGPLVISASVWWVEDATVGLDLYKQLKRVVSKSPPRASVPPRTWVVADSKVLYSPAQGLAQLERGVLAALGLIDRCPDDWQDVWQALHPQALDQLPTMPWHVDYDLRLPLAADIDDLGRLVPKLRRQLAERGVRLVAVASRAVFPGEFNARTESDGNKSEALSKITLALVADMLELCRGEPTLVVCDKHGGRNYYNRLLQQQFPDPLVEVRGESNRESVYAWGPEDERIEVRFRAEGESFLPAALASMTSKYLRELAMRAFNDFWCARIDDLRPTAGYPKDAHRFRAAIRETQLTLGIADDILWRNR
jgi:ribonuclease HII